MRGSFILMLITVLVRGSPVAAASPPIIVAGSWSTYADETGFEDSGASTGGRIAMVLPAGSHHFLLRMTKGGWGLSAAARQPVNVAFDGGASFALLGTGSGDVLQAEIDDSQVAAWTHAFTARSVMTVSFPDRSEAPVGDIVVGHDPDRRSHGTRDRDCWVDRATRPWEPNQSPPAATEAGPPAAPTVLPTPRADCVPRGPVMINGYYSLGNALIQQRACEEGYARLAEQQRQEEAAARERARRAQAAERQAALAASERIRAEQAAEESPDNHCRVPRVAGQVITAYNDFDKVKLEGGPRVVDIEHIRTAEWDEAGLILACHGVFVFTNGIRLSGTMTMHPNVAGDIIDTWEPDR